MGFGPRPIENMASHFRKFLESIVFAGMKPGKAKVESGRIRWLGPLRDPLERFLSGGRQQDPLYLSNRTFSQKLMGWLKVGAVLLVAAAVVVFALVKYQGAQQAPAALSPAEAAAKMLPNLSKPIHVNADTDLEVMEVHVDHLAGDRLKGKIRNNTGHKIQDGEVYFFLTGATGSQVGAANVKVSNLAAGQIVAFDQPVPEKTATFAIVREVHTR
jgi:hypothetical protein